MVRLWIPVSRMAVLVFLFGFVFLIGTVSYCEILSLMHLYWTPFLLSSLISAHSLDPSTLLHRPPSHLNNTALQHPRQPISNLTFPNVHCNGDIYRRDLQYPSCADALFSIPRGDRILTWDSRYSVVYRDVGLPYRWISGLSIQLSEI